MNHGLKGRKRQLKNLKEATGLIFCTCYNFTDSSQIVQGAPDSACFVRHKTRCAHIDHTTGKERKRDKLQNLSHRILGRVSQLATTIETEGTVHIDVRLPQQTMNQWALT